MSRLLRVAPILALVAPALHAQTGPSVIRVGVTEAGGARVAGAEVSLVHGVKDVAASGTTGEDGTRTLSAVLAKGEYRVVVRKVGYAMADRFFTSNGRDTLSFEIAVRRVPQSLEQVTVRDRASLKRQLYFADADAIASAPTWLADGLDVLTRLRPDMLYGVSGMCPPPQHVWVNGKRIANPMPNAMLAEEHRFANGNVAGQGGRPARRTKEYGRAAIPLDVGSVLAAIRPEHIAELRYNDCDDLSVQKARSTGAIFVVLKDGVRWDRRRGSYVLASGDARDSARAATVMAAIEGKAPPTVALPPVPTPPARVDALPPFRFRVLGVFDEASGAPVSGAEVIDVRTGTRAVTTATGTVSLAFLPAGSDTVRLVRSGYQPLELPVTISPADTVPITTLLKRTPDSR